MKKIIIAAFLMAQGLTPAFADPCNDLIAAVEDAMANPALTPSQKSHFESLLRLGLTAKAEGNLAACQNAMQSPAPSGQERHCEKTPDTV
jgi:hypothetical protein